MALINCIEKMCIQKIYCYATNSHPFLKYANQSLDADARHLPQFETTPFEVDIHFILNE